MFGCNHFAEECSSHGVMVLSAIIEVVVGAQAITMCHICCYLDGCWGASNDMIYPICCD